MLRQLHSDLWVADAPLRFGGVEIGSRMTVVRLPEGRLWLHSPIEPAPALVSEVEALGSVTYLVAPNRMHHLSVGRWHEAFPNAALYVAPGLETKRSDLKITNVLTDEPEPGWAGTLDQLLVEGFPIANEVDFFHRPSATLIVTDLAFNIGPESPLATRLAFRLGGAYGRLSPTHLERILIRDRPAFRRSLDRVLAWPFERVVVSHGRVSEQGGRAQLERGYAWV